MKIIIISLFSLMFAATIDPPSKSPPSMLRVDFQNGRMTVKAEQVTLKDLLKEIEAKSGIVVDLKDMDGVEKRVSAQFENVLPARVLREILRGLNFALFYSGTQVERVVIVPPGVQIARPKGGFFANNPFQEWSERRGNGPLLKPKPPLEDSKEDKRVRSKLEAIEAVESSEDPKDVSFLGDALTDKNAEVKSAALEALSDRQGTLVTQMLRRGLNDPDPEFRIEVLEALAERSDLESLRKALSDRNQEVKEKAAELLEDAKAGK